MVGRTTNKWTRFYLSGLDMSGYARSVGALSSSYDQVDLVVLDDALHGFLPGQVTNSIGPVNANLDNTASTGLHVVASGLPVLRVLSAALGSRAEPVAGDPVFSGEFEHLKYEAAGDADVAVTLEFAVSAEASTRDYPNPWGKMIHPKGAETAVNTGTNDVDHGAVTALGGYMAYHLLSSNGTVTLKVQDSDTDANPNFGDLVSSGVIDASASPASAVVALSKTATVERYLRWQIVLGTATTATFVISFSRAIA